MVEPDKIEDYLQRLTPLARSNLLTELERLEVCGADMPGSAPILEKLRAEFRKAEQIPKSGQATKRVAHPSRYFFMPLEPLLVDGDPEHANAGRIRRGSLAPIWEWITRDLLPTMARDYVDEMQRLIVADNQREAKQIAVSFQTKIMKYLDSTLGSPAGVDQTQKRLATYTASHSVYDDLTKMRFVLRARDALAKFNDALPAAIDEFDNIRLSKVTELLDTLGTSNAEEIPFGLAMVAKRLKTPVQLIRLASKAAPSKSAADIAAMPYAIAVTLVLDRLDDDRSALRTALKNERVLAAKALLLEIYAIEDALRAQIDRLDGSDWGKRLRDLMNAIAAMVAAELSRFPDQIDHVLATHNLRGGHQTLAGRLTSLAWKGRHAVSGGAAYCRKLIG
jgi:flagellin-specific chaperone FliS